ncbi:hypothetical protein ACTMU2_05840 [Cupriavidus basilensis]
MKARPLKILLHAGVLAAGALAVTMATAKITQDDLKQLDGNLTPLGAERAANKDGTIPAWAGKWLGAPTGLAYKTGERYPDPYADENRCSSSPRRTWRSTTSN